jgi:hypothetical protein
VGKADARFNPEEWLKLFRGFKSWCPTPATREKTIYGRTPVSISDIHGQSHPLDNRSDTRIYLASIDIDTPIRHTELDGVGSFEWIANYNKKEPLK